ncbi:MAG: thioredoxin family protein [Calditrichaceae bacterium]|nr:thioredoxin family protein [Calditrichaceae bacterium]MBN2709611.1 thioredoxin family protein [Calditrichaceae bacterium]RQV92408.1 MAG: thioredoxin [Calditrichota bacterium]
MEIILYIILALAGFFVFAQLYIRIIPFLKKGKKIKFIKGALGNKLSQGERNLLYFYTKSCSACKPMTPVIDKLQKEFNNIHKIDLAKDMETAKAFGVMGVPALIIVENSTIANYHLGYKSESAIRKLLP